ncbi:hypothetical protein [Salinarimonas sp.]|uniref:hypothetical protein n=1 Tax=Salinarimonas sp. TaxID=2766526 RepID=UPI003919668E
MGTGFDDFDGDDEMRLRDGVAAGDDDARVSLASFLERRRGDAAREEILELLRPAAEAGHAPAQLALARRLEAEGMLQEAARRYMAAAADGEEDAMLAMSRLYREGRGVGLDPEAATIWQRRALAAGLARISAKAGERSNSAPRGARNGLSRQARDGRDSSCGNAATHGKANLDR